MTPMPEGIPMKTLIASGVALMLATLPVRADQTNVAVAANFTEAATEIATAFHAATGHEAILSFGSTGQLYTQISQGAPFEVFLSADATRPAKAVAEGFGVPGSIFTYAIGQLALWSADPALVTGPESLSNPAITRIALANPETAPYGAAALQTLTHLGLLPGLADKLVQGNSISQTYQFVQTGNAEVGFVAYSQVVDSKDGSLWKVSPDLYDPIRQDAVLLEKGAESVAAKAFVDFLHSPLALRIIVGYGYAVEAAEPAAPGANG